MDTGMEDNQCDFETRDCENDKFIPGNYSFLKKRKYSDMDIPTILEYINISDYMNVSDSTNVSDSATISNVQSNVQSNVKYNLKTDAINSSNHLLNGCKKFNMDKLIYKIQSILSSKCYENSVIDKIINHKDNKIKISYTDINLTSLKPVDKKITFNLDLYAKPFISDVVKAGYIPNNISHNISDNMAHNIPHNILTPYFGIILVSFDGYPLSRKYKNKYDFFKINEIHRLYIGGVNYLETPHIDVYENKPDIINNINDIIFYKYQMIPTNYKDTKVKLNDNMTIIIRFMENPNDIKFQQEQPNEKIDLNMEIHKNEYFKIFLCFIEHSTLNYLFFDKTKKYQKYQQLFNLFLTNKEFNHMIHMFAITYTIKDTPYLFKINDVIQALYMSYNL